MLPPIKVAVIDDDAAMLRALVRLIKSAGIEASAFSSARKFLDDPVHQEMDCAVTDMRMPGVDGLKLQQELNKALPHLSIVFIIGHGSVPMTVKAMKGGAVDFLEKPVDDEALLTAIHRAADRSRALRASREELVAIERRYGRMTPRERQVFSLVTAGSLNKQNAFDLSVAERTVKVHRARVMEKMEAGSFAHLVQMAQLLSIHAVKERL
jgi:FixJ family two-component response regulator